MKEKEMDIYLDASSTSPPSEKVIHEIHEIQNKFWGNPSSLHTEGIKAAYILEQSRYIIAEKFSIIPEQIIFTSGATESVYIALNQTANNMSPGRIIISSVEHPSVIYSAQQLVKSGWELVRWPVDKFGVIDMKYLDEFLKYPTKIVSLIWGQSEIGSLQPISYIANLCKQKGIYFHTDATQVIPQGIINFSSTRVSSLSASAHKFRGPKGIGLLIIDLDYINLLKSNYKHSQEYGIRMGTQAIPLIKGMAVALEELNAVSTIADDQLNFEKTTTTILTNLLRAELLKIDELSLTGHPIIRLPNHLSFLLTHKGVPISSRRVVTELSKIGIYVSSGSACTMNKDKDSYVLESTGISKKYLKSNLRLSLGSWIKDLDIQLVYNSINSIINDITK